MVRRHAWPLLRNLGLRSAVFRAVPFRATPQHTSSSTSIDPLQSPLSSALTIPSVDPRRAIPARCAQTQSSVITPQQHSAGFILSPTTSSPPSPPLLCIAGVTFEPCPHSLTSLLLRSGDLPSLTPRTPRRACACSLCLSVGISPLRLVGWVLIRTSRAVLVGTCTPQL